MNNKNLIKRKYVYTQSPQYYEIPGCSCGNQNIQWSEYENMMWCEKCQKDFKPEHYGVFDSPIPLGICNMLNVSFDRIHLETEEIEIFMEGNYITAIDLNKHSIQNLISFQLYFNNFENKINMTGFLKDNTIIFNELNKMSENYQYKLLLGFYDNKIRKWNITAIKQNKKLHFEFKTKENEIEFKSWLLSHELKGQKTKQVKQKI